MKAEAEPLTTLLQAAHRGDVQAADAAYAQLYPELLKIARARLRGHAAPTLLDTHALVHESFMRFVGAQGPAIESRKHFYAYAAKAMRHIVIDFVRRQQAQRRGGDWAEVTFDTALMQGLPQAEPVLAVDEALAALAGLDEQLASVVEMRFFGGYDDVAIGQALGVSERTVRRLWDKARAVLLVQLAAQ